MQVVAAALRVLEVVISAQPIGVSELARRTGIPKSNVQRALLTLADENWIQMDPEGSKGWVQAPKILSLASRGLGNSMRDIARPVMQELLVLTNENVHLNVRQADNLVVLDKLESTHPVRVFDPLGTTVPLHASASGKAILAWAEPADVEDYISRMPEQFTAETIIQPDLLRQELKQIRELGYSFNRGEWRSEIRGIAAPVVERRGAPRFAISLSVPTHRFPDELVPEFSRLVLDAAQKIIDSL